MEGICWNNENEGLAPQSPDLKPIEQIWGELENKLDRSIVHSKESLWLELQKAWNKISVEVLWKYIDTMSECCCNCCKRWTYQILKLKVDKNSKTLHLIFAVLRATICMFHDHYEMKSCFGGKKEKKKEIDQIRSVRCSKNVGHLCV